jgi:predicted RNA-binding Zn-ribbon protein involved in translation (DUF1610 family)
VVLTVYRGAERLKAAAVREIVVSRACPDCGSHLLRIAVREMFAPYHWIPSGYQCSTCSFVLLDE